MTRQTPDSVVVLLGALDVPLQAQLDGFKTRALRAEAPALRHLYATDWRALDIQPQEAGRAPTLVFGGTRPELRGHERVGLAVPRDALGAGAWRAVVMAAATQRGRAALRPLCALESCFALVQAQAAKAPPLSVVLLTFGAQPARGVPSAAHSGTWGFRPP